MIQSAKSIGFLVCADATQEEVQLLKKTYPTAEFFSYSPSVKTSADDQALDHLVRRKDKSPNMKGLEELGLKPYGSFDPKKYDLCIFISAGKVRPPYGLAKLAKKAIAMGLFLKEELAGYHYVLPAPSTYEKSGTFVNHQGVKQTFKAAISPVGMSRPIESILGALAESPRKVG
jgi:hypothetical protein